PEGAILDVPKDAIITDIAREWIEKKRIRLVSPETNPSVQPEKARVAVGSDHAGFEMKEAVKALLGEEGISFIDFGTYSTESVDYPDFAHAVAVAVAVGRTELGIVVDGAGIGSAIVANKVPGVRAAPCQDATTARNSREHNDANVLTLGAGLIGVNLAKQIVQTWLSTPFGGGRHQRRVDKIVEIEKRFLKSGQ
ncbi:MAG TPA: ribose 5-phosphate isomerase B, partial [Anaerolineales bacterium]|nr:ribose 5-phosphate isomerase B [Anaerolineales bacterium]